MKSAIFVLVGAAVVGTAVGVGPVLTDRLATTHASSDSITGCRVTDGDTIRCGEERIRLLGIDAPELPGHCREGRECAPGDPYAATSSLEAAMAGELHIHRVGEDRYGRTLALVAGERGDLSCWQLTNGHAIYKFRWDDGYRVARLCPSATRSN